MLFVIENKYPSIVVEVLFVKGQGSFSCKIKPLFRRCFDPKYALNKPILFRNLSFDGE